MDETKRPLGIPPEFTMYAEKNEIFSMYEVSTNCMNIIYSFFHEMIPPSWWA